VPSHVERRLTALEPPPFESDDLEADAHVRRRGVACQPDPSRRTKPAALFGVDGSESAAEARPGSLLDLDERQVPPTPHDQVELVAAAAHVRPEDAIAALAVVPKSPPLAAVYAAAGTGPGSS
jgi:hypothetical protein